MIDANLHNSCCRFYRGNYSIEYIWYNEIFNQKGGEVCQDLEHFGMVKKRKKKY